MVSPICQLFSLLVLKSWRDYTSLLILVDPFSSFVTCLCMSFDHSSLRAFVFFLLIFNSSLYMKVIPLCALGTQSDSQTPWGGGGRDRPC